MDVDIVKNQDDSLNVRMTMDNENYPSAIHDHSQWSLSPTKLLLFSNVSPCCMDLVCCLYYVNWVPQITWEFA